MKAVFLLVWMVIQEQMELTEGVCSLTIPQIIVPPSIRAAQLTCGEINCHFNDCEVVNRSAQQCTTECDQEFTPCTTTCCSQENCLDYIMNSEFLLLIEENPEIVDRICPEIQTLCSEYLENQQCTNRPPTTLSLLTSQTKIMDRTKEQDVVITSLGVLVGLLVVLLAVVTTGWVYTCWIMTQKEKNKIKSEQVRTTQNTAYGVTVPVNNSSLDQMASTNSDQLGNTHQAGGRDIQNNRHLMGNDEEHEYQVLEGSGETTGVHQNRELEMREMRGSGEEHTYHVIEGSGSGNASRETGVRGVGGAMDYEIPLPLKK